MSFVGKISRIAFVTLLLFCWSVSADFTTYENVRLLDSPANDGDSFIVEADGKRMHLRLYYVDCTETSNRHDHDRRRLLEQTRYFGLENAGVAMHYGEVAKEFVEKQLSEPFTVITAYANARGAAGSNRIYAFVVTANGEYLDRLLVREGLARPKGVHRRTPDDIHHDEMWERLRDMEAAAIWHRRGIWKDTNPEKMGELRIRLREEEREIAGVGESETAYPIDINTATKEELQTLPGIGRVRSKRIIEARPFESLDELHEIRFMPRNVVREIKPKLYIGDVQM